MAEFGGICDIFCGRMRHICRMSSPSAYL